MSTTENNQFVVLVVLSALPFLLNGTFLIAICKSWRIVKRKRVTYHVTNLNKISDFLVGAGTFCKYITIVVAGKMTTLSLVFHHILWTAALTSFLAVCLMVIERLLCIIKPLTWNEILPLRRILRMYFYPLKMTIIFYSSVLHSNFCHCIGVH